MRKHSNLSLLVFLLINFGILYPQTIMINEIMASNTSIITDSDGDFPDWIELYNNSSDEIDLKNFGLSDDSEELFKWTFPSITLAAKEHLLVFASDKDKKEFNHTIITQGDTWKYKIGTSPPPYTWHTVGFRDDNWSEGKTGIGYGDGDDDTEIPAGTISLYARKSFYIDDKSNILNALLALDYDDGFVAYLNGTEIARANLTGNPPAYNETANPDHEAQLYQGKYPKNFKIENINDLIVNGKNTLAVQVHNASEYSSDFSFIPYLTLRVSSKPDDIFTPSELPLTPVSLHTNFKISAAGETLILTSQDGTILDQITTDEMTANISYGRKPDGSEEWRFFNAPTPGEANTTSGYDKISPDVIFDKPGGFYENKILLSLSVEEGNYPVYYTLDGSEPTINSHLYTGPVSINETTVVRARVIDSNALSGKITTRTYFLHADHDLPAISLATDPPNLWDPDSGIYVLGHDYQHEIPYFGANFWEDWEKPVHLELYEPDGSFGFNVNAGMKIFGGWSRSKPQKSLAIYARKEYGTSEINYQVFPDRNIHTFENIVLRNAANDFEFAMLRDGFMQSLVEDSHIDDQAYRPAVVYLNGEYWGIHNIREKLNEHYVASHHDVDPDNIDLLESHGQANHGDADDWWYLYSFIEANDMQNADNFEYVKSKIDMNNFIEYYISEIYFDNTDWPGNNIKYWKEKSNTGKWRWMLFDTDFGFGLYDGHGYLADQRYKHNTLKFALAPNGPGWPNPPWSTLVLRKFLTNFEFKNKFVNYFCDFLNTRFKPSTVHDKLDQLKSKIETEMPAHIDRWNAIGSVDNWYSHINRIRTFGTYRAGYCMSHLNSVLDLNGTATLTLKIKPENSGMIRINHITIDDPNWQGNYFKTIPIDVEAIPNPGYKFDQWSGDILKNYNEIYDWLLYSNRTLTCHFTEAAVPDDAIVINEINYKSADDFDTGDWVEFYNNSDATIDMSNWVFKDSENDHIFEFPDEFSITPRTFLVLTENQSDFSDLQPDIGNILGDFDFGLSKTADILRLYNREMELVDSVSFTSEAPWPAEPKGSGATLALKSPDFDNTLAENWTSSTPYGTPGRENFATPIADENDAIPSRFKLKQNYPNPFNRATVISFDIAKPGIVRMILHNIAGQKILTITDEYFHAGTYKINFYPDDNVPSGIYFYSLLHNDKIIATRKLVYLK